MRHDIPAITSTDLIRNGISALKIGEERLARRSFAAAADIAREAYERRQKIDGYSSKRTDAAWQALAIARAFDMCPSRAEQLYGDRI